MNGMQLILLDLDLLILYNKICVAGNVCICYSLQYYYLSYFIYEIHLEYLYLVVTGEIEWKRRSNNPSHTTNEQYY